jgi:hypothetical protein
MFSALNRAYSNTLLSRFFPTAPESSSHPPSLLLFVGSSKNAYPVPDAPHNLSVPVIGSYCLYVQGELMRHTDPKKSLPIFSMAASLHNSSALSQAIASVHYSAGEVAGAYYALHAAALQEGEKITRMQFWQMYFPRAQPGLCRLFFSLTRLLGTAAPVS